MDDEARYSSLTSPQRASLAQNHARRTAVRPEARPSCVGLLQMKWRALIKSKAECTLFNLKLCACSVWAQDQVNQVDGFTGEVVRRWDSAAAVAASFGVPVHRVEDAATRGSCLPDGSMFSWAMPRAGTYDATS